MNHRYPRFLPMQNSARGFSLLEIMIALALGLLLSAGIVTLFASTSETNKLQDGLARLQENGRFAVSRMENDSRMVAGQYCSNTSGKSAPAAIVPMIPVRAPQVYAPNIGAALPTIAAGWHDSGNIRSVNAVTGAPSTVNATIPYGLSPRWFVQGYSCTATSTCAPTVPATGINDVPAEGLVAGRRLPLSDVLTLRYQRGTGWPLQNNQCLHGGAPAKADDSLAGGDTFTVSPQIGDSPFTMTQGVALVSDCANSNIIPIRSVSLNTLTIDPGILAGAPGSICMGSPLRDVRVFDFSKDFVTVTYYIGLRADPNPDARLNSAAATRLLPTLIRRENGVEQELVQGVDQLKFLYGVQDSGGNTRFMTADQVNSGVGFCPPVTDGIAQEPGCLWRAVRTIEAHMLVNTVDEVFGLDPTSRQYTFMNASVTTTDTGALPSGLIAGSMMRREFVSYLSNRNYNF
ncbi:MAG: PilW family protein [Dokdonella sp.]